MADLSDQQSQDGVTDSPKKGPTLSTSTSSFEALDPHDPKLSHLASTTFAKTADYLYGELTSTQEEYKLLENMNKAIVTKYNDMKHIAVNIAKNLSELKDKCDNLQPFLDQIDQIEDSITKLEQAAYKLDAYSKRLETKFKSLEKR